ncbi:MAG TPA: sigma-54 dependent transcriptional regulator [Planctomycetota bacterium]|nr:sigma-54 dependent transcriptional regulator [Planctomycetota bacterium]
MSIEPLSAHATTEPWPHPESIPHPPRCMIGRSPAIRQLFDLIAKVAPTDATVLITGESGTGKELVAREIHHCSPRSSRPLVTQNCAALNDNLLESELFGHIRGSFTDATDDKPGLFDLADGGTLFLDEVSEMSPALQVKLLRVLQESRFVPVGGVWPHSVDVRLLAATNLPLEELVSRGRFRQDLYYRLHVFTLDTPPLRERREDIPLLARHILARAGATMAFAPEALRALCAYAWPGNVRELENEVQRALILARGEPVLGLDHVSPAIRDAAAERAPLRGRRIDGTLAEALEDLERDLLAAGLRRNRWNKSHTARDLGISRANLVAKVRKYHLQPAPLTSPPSPL